MSATASTAINAATVAPPRAAAETRAASSSEHAFDRRLDAARQQRHHDEAATPDEQPSKPSTAKSPGDAKAADPSAKAAAKAAVETKDPADAASDAASLAAAMLALLGQSAPVPAPVVPLRGALAAADTPRNALAALTAGKPKAVDTTLGALLGVDAATATADAAPTTLTVVSGAATRVGDLLPGIDAAKDDRTAALPDFAAQVAAFNTPASSPASAAPAAHLLSVTSAVGTPAFTQDLGRQVTWLGSQNLKEARIKLHPEDLGALDVKVTISHDRVDLTFIAQHPATVHAVQQSLAHLDAMLAQQGMTLGHADVSQQQHGSGSGQGSTANGGFGETDEPGVAAMTPVSSLAPTLLDTFA